jgi:hypothetical protein
VKITKRDFDAWWALPVGMEFKKLLHENLDKLAHNSKTENYARDQIGNAIEVGKYEATKFYLNITFRELMGEEDE